jgi:hypothetical protein
MTKEEIKALSKKEIQDLLTQNTKELRYDSEAIMSGYDFVFNQYLTHRNFILEEKQLWDVILLGFFQFDGEVIDGIEEVLGWYELMVWCFNNLKQIPEIGYYVKRYYDFHIEKLSTGEVLSGFITTFVDDLGAMDLDVLKNYASNLGVELSKLPNMVKDQLK